MLLKQHKPRKFDYTPQFLKQDKEESQEGRRIIFGRIISGQRKGASILKLILMIGAMLGVMYYLNKYY